MKITNSGPRLTGAATRLAIKAAAVGQVPFGTAGKPTPQGFSSRMPGDIQCKKIPSISLGSIGTHIALYFSATEKARPQGPNISPRRVVHGPN